MLAAAPTTQVTAPSAESTDQSTSGLGISRVVCKTFAEYQVATADYNFKTISFDTETKRQTRINWYTIELVGFSFFENRRAVYVDFDLLTPQDKLSTLELLNKQLSGCSLLIMHNSPFDLKVLWKHGVFPKAELFDTMVASHLLDENRTDKRLQGKGHGLKQLASEFLNADIKKYKEAEEAGIHSELFYEYAQNDAIFTYQLCSIFMPFIKEQDLTRLFREIEMPFQRVLARMEMNGVLVDRDRIARDTETLKKQVGVLEEALLKILEEPYEVQHDLFGNKTIKCKINLGSPKQLAAIIFDRLGLPVVEHTKSGARSVGKLTLQKLSGKHPFIDKLNEYRKLQKLLNAFFEPLPSFIDGDGRVRANYRDTGTVTGRLSSNTPNLQQLPRPDNDPFKLRGCFVAPPGYQMITADYSGQEVCVLAHLSQDEQLIEGLKRGYDLHLAMARDFMDLPIPDECLAKTHPEYHAYTKKFKSERSKAKTITFGLAYGKSAFGFAKDFGITEEEGQQILDNYFARFPGVKQAIDHCTEDATTNGCVTQHFGRRRRFPLNQWNQVDKKSLRQAFNFLIQSPSADMIRLAAINVQNIADSNPAWDLQIVMTVHDELVFIAKEEYSEAAKEMIHKAFMEATTSFSVPFDVDVGSGPSYADAK